MSAKRHKSSHSTDAVKLALMLSELRLPAMKQMWSGFAERADTEGWPAARLLSTLAELELAERDRRRIERHLKEARLVPGKTISSFDFNLVPVVSKSKVMALAAGDVWLNNGHNLLMFGPPGTGKSHSIISNRTGPGGKRLSCAVHSNHRPGATPATGTSRIDARKSAGAAGPISFADSGRFCLRQQRSGWKPASCSS